MNEQTSSDRVSPETTRVGWIGTGVMGASMAGHVLSAGYRLTVFNRTAAKADALVAAGAARASSPRTVAESSDVVFTIVGHPYDVEAVILGEDGVLDHAAPGSVLVDMTTSRPTLAERIAEVARSRGVDSVDAPVSGGDAGAREARLSIMVGGDPDVVDRIMPLLEVMGKTIVHQGGHGLGQHTKMVNQTLIASNMISICEALLYAQKAGLDIESVLRSVGSGAAGSFALSSLAPRMIRGDFEPGFFVEHFVKDMGIALDEAKRMHLALPGLALAHQLYQAVLAAGDGRRGTQVLIETLARINSMTWKTD